MACALGVGARVVRVLGRRGISRWSPRRRSRLASCCRLRRRVGGRFGYPGRGDDSEIKSTTVANRAGAKQQLAARKEVMEIFS